MSNTDFAAIAVQKKIAEAAKEFVFDGEVWEAYKSMEDSTSAALPPYFMALCEAVEEYYGSPADEDENKEPEQCPVCHAVMTINCSIEGCPNK